MVRAFDIFQMLDVLQDFRGTVSQQVSPVFYPSLLHLACQGCLHVGRCPRTDCWEMQMCHLVTPAMLPLPGRDSLVLNSFLSASLSICPSSPLNSKTLEYMDHVVFISAFIPPWITEDYFQLQVIESV